MLRPLHCIALRTIKYSERHNILAAYSLEMGRVSLLVSASAGREAMRRRAATMALSPIECVADMSPTRDIHPMRDARVIYPIHGIHSNPIKAAVAMFLAETLTAILTENQPDEPLYAYLDDAIQHLDQASTEASANFHLAFMYRLSRFLGIEPDVSSYGAGRVFDMVDAVFRDTPPVHRRYLPADRAAMVRLIARMTWDNLEAFRFNRGERRSILSTILEYYTLHYASLQQLKSLDVLEAMFN